MTGLRLRPAWIFSGDHDIMNCELSKRLAPRMFCARLLLVLAVAACIRAYPAETRWQVLFDGKTLAGWKVTEFGGPKDEVHIKDGELILEMGAADMSGVTYTKPVPTLDYEIGLEAKRLEGSDMFCCLTFPIDTSHCSLVVGGWGGTLVGLSSFDLLDASQNETTAFMEFENDRWYRIRLRVTEGRIQAWIDDKRVVDALPGDRTISVRWEVETSRPLGLAAWNTKAALRHLRLRKLSASEVEASQPE